MEDRDSIAAVHRSISTDVRLRAAAVEASVSAAKLIVTYNLKDGRWRPGNVTITFPRRHGSEKST